MKKLILSAFLLFLAGGLKAGGLKVDSASSSGGSLSIGSAVTGSAANELLYNNSAGNLANSANASFDGTTATFSVVAASQFVGTGGTAPIITSTYTSLTVTIGSTSNYRFYASSATDPAGARFITGENGWITSTGTWTALGSTSFTVTGDATGLLGQGTKLKFTNNSVVQYYYVQSTVFSTISTVTIVGTLDYTMVAGAITNPQFSWADNAQGFPDVFTATTTVVGFSANPGASIIRYWLKPHVAYVNYYNTATGTSNATSFSITGPVTSQNLTAGQSSIGPWTGSADLCDDSGTILTATSCGWNVGPATTTITFLKNTSATGWTASGNKSFSSGVVTYFW